MKVRASEDDTSDATVLTIIPVNIREVAIYHEATGNFLGMDAEGKIMTSVRFWFWSIFTVDFQPDFTYETQFKENVYNNYYAVYASLEYPTRTSKERVWDFLQFLDFLAMKVYHRKTSTEAKTLNKAAREGQDASLEAPEEWLVSVRSNFE